MISIPAQADSLALSPATRLSHALASADLAVTRSQTSPPPTRAVAGLQLLGDRALPALAPFTSSKRQSPALRTLPPAACVLLREQTEQHKVTVGINDVAFATPERLPHWYFM